MGPMVQTTRDLREPNSPKCPFKEGALGGGEGVGPYDLGILPGAHQTLGPVPPLRIPQKKSPGKISLTHVKFVGTPSNPKAGVLIAEYSEDWDIVGYIFWKAGLLRAA